MSRIPFVLVTGFLGSGKTTFVKQMLKKYGSKKKVAVIQNEFAPANTDGTELRNEGKDFSLLEINNGSAFCVCLLGDFITSLQKFMKTHLPEVIFMEASGLSDPIAIAQLLELKDLKKEVYLAKVLTIVDPVNFMKCQKYITRVRHQIRIADTVILNKTDLCDPEQLKNAKPEIKKLNPFAEIIQSTYCNIPDQDFFPDTIKSVAAKNIRDQNNAFESCGRPEISVGVFRSSRSVSEDKLTELIDIYANKTIRMKGFAKLVGGGGMAVQTTFDQKEFKRIENYEGSTEIIAMGEKFELSEFSRNYRETAK